MVSDVSDVFFPYFSKTKNDVGSDDGVLLLWVLSKLDIAHME
jgi:hypothetical protein